jgi:nucleoid DNA-binding protein
MADKKAMNKSQIVGSLAESTGLSKKDVAGVLENLNALALKELGSKGPHVFTLPGLLKLTVSRKPATKAKEGRNPFTGETIMIKAKPARNVVRARVLKAVKDAV